MIALAECMKKLGESDRTAASRHHGIVNVLMMDGSTRTIKSSININAWWGLGTRVGGEIIGSDQL